MVLCLVILSMAIFSVTAQGREKAIIEIKSQTSFAGGTVNVPIYMNANPGVVVVLLNVGYDSDVLTLVNVEDKNIMGEHTHGNSYTANPYTLYWNNNIAKENFTATGTIAVLQFEVNADAPKGDTEITIGTVKYGVLNKDTDEVESDLISGKVTIGDAFVQYTPASEFTFATNAAKGTAVITGFVGTSAKVNIASSYDIGGKKYSVTGIGEEAFYGNKTVSSVVIPDSVTAIEDYAFYDCTKLTSYTVNGNPTIGEAALGYYNKGTARKPENAAVAGVTYHAWSGDKTVTSNVQAYAKNESSFAFVGLEDFDYVGCQLSTDNKTADKFNIRFAGIINSLNYQKVGFEVSAVAFAKSWVSESTTVYKFLNGTTPDGKNITAVTAEECGGEYIFALAITKVPTKTAVEFKVTPYVVNQLGAKVYGNESIVKVTASGEVS